MNPTELAQKLAFHAQYLRHFVIKQLKEKQKYLHNLYNNFKEALVYDQTEEEFADAFAQTITYGLLTLRLMANDQLLEHGGHFTRQTALNHLPDASPFLNDLFNSALSLRLNRQASHLFKLVDDITSLLDKIDVKGIFNDTQSDNISNTIIHFYELFLTAYDKKLKNKLGVFFTPRPVVSYIVRSVHELLQSEFKLEDGLASTNTWGDMQKHFVDLKLPKDIKPTDPFVCILDPSTGTGTFLFECIEIIEYTMKERWCRELNKNDWKDHQIVTRWCEYVPKYLLPRLYGYELMMASYTIAHLKLSAKLSETGYYLKATDRIQIYLTNSLEQPLDREQEKLTRTFLACETQAVNKVKCNKLFTIVIGNPPYSLMSSNLSKSQRQIINSYKFVDNKKIKERGSLQLEKNLQDDYVKFIRIAQIVCERSPLSIMGFITNHAYIDNPTLRGLRRSLMNTFCSISVLDLHGNSKRKERSCFAEKDENVFDIQQGVAIGFFVRKFNIEEQDTYWNEMWGSRRNKYANLKNATSFTLFSKKFKPIAPLYIFLPQNNVLREEFHAGMALDEIFSLYSTGVATARDRLTVHFTKTELCSTLHEFSSLSIEQAREQFVLGQDTKDWKVELAQNDIKRTGQNESCIKKYLYRPFDLRYTYYTGQPRGFHCNPRRPVMQHLLDRPNIALCTVKAIETSHEYFHVFVANSISDHHCVSLKEVNYILPMFIYSFEPETLPTTNISKSFMSLLINRLGIRDESEEKTFLSAQTIMSYIYGILHSFSYRKRYAEFLRKEFARIPIPLNRSIFISISQLGTKLISLHLMDSQTLIQPLSSFINNKISPVVEKVSYEGNVVWIDKNKTNGFKGVAEDVWNFYIGGYKVCEKWLKDRKGRILSNNDIEQYKKILVAISETLSVMKEIDEVINKHGGWPDAFIKVV